MEVGQIENLVKKNGIKSQLRLMNRQALEDLLLSKVYNVIDAHTALDQVSRKLDEVNRKRRMLEDKVISLNAQVSKLLEATSVDMKYPRTMQTEAYRIQRNVGIQHRFIGRAGAVAEKKNENETESCNSAEKMIKDAKECNKIVENAVSSKQEADLSKPKIEAKVVAQGKSVAVVVPAQIFTPPLPRIVNLRPCQSTKLYPPRPSLQARLAGTSIDLIWTATLLPEHAEIQKYQVYYFRTPWESWLKLYESSGQPTPLCVNVSEIESGRYSFIVRGIDVFNRTGPFSPITSVTL